MPSTLRSLTYATVFAALILGVACTNDGDATPSATVDHTATSTAGGTETPTATPPPVASPSPVSTPAPIAAAAYTTEVCARAAEATNTSFDAFVAAAAGYDAAVGDPLREAAAVLDWAVASGSAWLDVADWAASVEPDGGLSAFHADVGTSFVVLALERSNLAQELAGETDPSAIWIAAQRAWAMELLEPLRFIPAGQFVPSGVMPSFATSDCGPLFVAQGDTVALSSSPQLGGYASQVCWLHQLAWEQQQLSLQDLALASDPAAGLEALRVAASTYARQEQRTQLLIGLGLQQLTPPDAIQAFHDAAFANSSARLVAVFDLEVAAADAATADAVNAALNDLLLQYRGFAEELQALAAGAPPDVRDLLDASAPCGALDGSELAFYDTLSS